MDDPISAARGAAKSLSGVYGPQLQIELEKRIAAGDETGPNVYDAGLIVAIASFLLAAAQFAYDVYKDQRERNAVDPEGIEREVRLRMEIPAELIEQERDVLIDTVVKEITS